jgi:hypothetical protein
MIYNKYCKLKKISLCYRITHKKRITQTINYQLFEISEKYNTKMQEFKKVVENNNKLIYNIRGEL